MKGRVEERDQSSGKPEGVHQSRTGVVLASLAGVVVTAGRERRDSDEERRAGVVLYSGMSSDRRWGAVA